MDSIESGEVMTSVGEVIGSSSRTSPGHMLEEGPADSALKPSTPILWTGSRRSEAVLGHSEICPPPP